MDMTSVDIRPAEHMATPQRYFSYKIPSNQDSLRQVPINRSPYAHGVDTNSHPDGPISRSFLTARQEPWIGDRHVSRYGTQTETSKPFFVRPAPPDTPRNSYYEMNPPSIHREHLRPHHSHSYPSATNLPSPVYYRVAGHSDRYQPEHVPLWSGSSRFVNLRNPMPQSHLRPPRSLPPRSHLPESRRPIVSNFRRYSSGPPKNDRLPKRPKGVRQQVGRDRGDRGGIRSVAAGALNPR